MHEKKQNRYKIRKKNFLGGHRKPSGDGKQMLFHTICFLVLNAYQNFVIVSPIYIPCFSVKNACACTHTYILVLSLLCAILKCHGSIFFNLQKVIGWTFSYSSSFVVKFFCLIFCLFTCTCLTKNLFLKRWLDMLLR